MSHIVYIFRTALCACVQSSSLLSSLSYVRDLRSMNADNCVIEFSDDAALLGLMHKNSSPSVKRREL